MDKLLKLWQGTGLYHLEPGQALMILVCLGLIYLAIRKGFEPLLLIPIGFGGLLSNIPVANMAEAVEAAWGPCEGLPFFVVTMMTPFDARAP